MFRKPIFALSSAAIVALLLLPNHAMAQSGGPVGGGPATGKQWDVMLGAGMMLRPTFEGSDRYKISPLPLVSVTYGDFISLGSNGLTAYWRRGDLQIGGGLTYSGGRDDKDSSIFGSGDKRLAGMGDIDGALGVRGFATYNLRPVVLSGSVTKFTGKKDQNDGLLVEFGASVPVRVTDKLTLSPNVGVTWADDNYMQTFFGVTSQQASRTRFARFNAGSGVKDVSVGVSANYRFDQNWFAGASATLKQLTGDAAKSGLSYSDSQGVFLLTAGYRF